MITPPAINAITGLINFTPSSSDVGSHVVDVTVCDNSGAGNACVIGSFNLTVLDVNDAPVFNGPIPDVFLPEDTNVTIDLNLFFMDPEMDPLSYTASSGADITVQIIGGNATIIPNADFNGVSTVNFTASDGEFSSNVSNNVLITVTPVSDAPTQILTIQNQNMINGTTIQLNLDQFFTDLDGDVLIYSAQGNVNVGISITGSVADITAPATFIGTETVSIVATDGTTPVVSNNFDIIVSDVPPTSELINTFVNGTGPHTGNFTNISGAFTPNEIFISTI